MIRLLFIDLDREHWYVRKESGSEFARLDEEFSHFVGLASRTKKKNYKSSSREVIGKMKLLCLLVLILASRVESFSLTPKFRAKISSWNKFLPSGDERRGFFFQDSFVFVNITEGNAQIVGLDLNSGRAKWTFSDSGAQFNRYYQSDNQLLIANHFDGSSTSSASVTLLDVNTGKQVWKRPISVREYFSKLPPSSLTLSFPVSSPFFGFTPNAVLQIRMSPLALLVRDRISGKFGHNFPLDSSRIPCMSVGDAYYHDNLDLYVVDCIDVMFAV